MKPSFVILAIAALVAAGTSHAQYKVVGPDGKITYTDRMPERSEGRVTNFTARDGGGGAELPYELRQVASKFPVTIYTAKDCDPCKLGRDLLLRRGVPFTERTANTQEDKDLWHKTTGTVEAPVLMVGKEQLRGFSQGPWNEALSTAGYPTTSKLPTNFQQAAATPLAPPRAPERPKAPPEPKRDLTATPSGEGGIRF